MNDLNTLRPEVREALACMDSCATVKPSSGDGFLDETWLTIRAELVRLARENAELRRAWDDALLTGTGILKVERIDPAAVMLPVEPRPRNETPVPKSEWEALTERAEKAEAELAALKARIAEAPVGVFGLCYNGHEPGFLGFPQAIDNLPRESMLGKRVRLVVEK